MPDVSVKPSNALDSDRATRHRRYWTNQLPRLNRAYRSAPYLISEGDSAVRRQRELDDGETPPSVRDWIANPPVWVEVKETPVRDLNDESLDGLDQGERAAIALAVAINADLLLMDDREGVVVARNRGFAVTGTLGVLSLAGRRGLVNLSDSFALLKRTNFRYRQGIMDEILAEQAGE
jgi:predicted nucleic acid-binding protein